MSPLPHSHTDEELEQEGRCSQSSGAASAAADGLVGSDSSSTSPQPVTQAGRSKWLQHRMKQAAQLAPRYERGRAGEEAAGRRVNVSVTAQTPGR